jgi:hypothetical protein
MDANSILRVGSKGRAGSSWDPRATVEQDRLICAAGGHLRWEWMELSAYAESGDLGDISPATYAQLTQVRKVCQEQVSESAGKRYWPRKIAAVLLTL